jgi:DNA-directed RNA polymerase specialized sigma24 family protein
MPKRASAAVLRAIRAVAAATEPTDLDLLTRFNAGDEEAFTALVERHGGMVLGVCSRALPTLQDAEDACQATFLVLASKARNGRWQTSVANWLYTTARRVASRARRAVV